MPDLIDRLIAREGGLVEDSHDPGGLTKYGISQRQYPTLNIRELTLQGARIIYERDYLWRTGINKIHFAPLQEQLLDFAVLSGPTKAIKTLQQLVGIKPDGLLGSDTLAAVNADADPTSLNNLLVHARIALLERLVRMRPSSAKYETGWVNRAKRFLL